MERWKSIPSLPDYEASSLGRIRRVPHVRPMPRGGVRTYGGQPWPGVWEKTEARYIVQYKGKTYRVHRLVCEAFNGPPPFEEAVCMHKDENSRNNTPDNLEWGTQKENMNAPGFLTYARLAAPEKFGVN